MFRKKTKTIKNRSKKCSPPYAFFHVWLLVEFYASSSHMAFPLFKKLTTYKHKQCMPQAKLTYKLHSFTILQKKQKQKKLFWAIFPSLFFLLALGESIIK
jgi:hypothetical protein